MSAHCGGLRWRHRSVSGISANSDYQLAMSPAAYTALRAWLESSPPGFNVNVA